METLSRWFDEIGDRAMGPIVFLVLIWFCIGWLLPKIWIGLEWLYWWLVLGSSPGALILRSYVARDAELLIDENEKDGRAALRSEKAIEYPLPRYYMEGPSCDIPTPRCCIGGVSLSRRFHEQRLNNMKCCVHLLILSILGVATVTACAQRPTTRTQVQPTSGIHETKAAHTESLMAIPGVVGVAIGESDGTPCIRVYLERDTEDVRQRVPTELDGHPVEIVVTGPFRTGG